VRLEQLKAFLAVIETGSFQKAALHCGLSQSTISRQIQSLETQLGAELFHRSTQVKLTVAGERFLPRAKKIHEEWDRALIEITDLLGGQQAELCVASIHSVCAQVLPSVVQQFTRDYPQVQLRVTALGSDRSIKVLRDGLVDIAIVMYGRVLPQSAEWSIDHLYDEEIEVLMAQNHPLAQYPRIPWPKASEYPQILFKDGYGMQRLIRDHFQHQKLPLNALLELNTLDAFRGVIKQGEFIALLPESALFESRLDPGLAIRPTEPPHLSRRVTLVTTQDRLRNPLIAHFRELVKQHLQVGFQ
jgi:DNA-binding transcriptional LysR family regulator